MRGRVLPAENRLGHGPEEVDERRRASVGHHDHARVRSGFGILGVRRDFERFPEEPSRRGYPQALEVEETDPAPGALDEVVRPQPENPPRDIIERRRTTLDRHEPPTSREGGRHAEGALELAALVPRGQARSWVGLTAKPNASAFARTIWSVESITGGTTSRP